MKTKREMPLSQALDSVVAVAEQLKTDESTRLNGQKLKLEDPVTLEIEMESGKKGGELEFEIKWPSEERKSRGRGKRFLLLVGLTGAAIGGAALVIAKKRRDSQYEEAAA